MSELLESGLRDPAELDKIGRANVAFNDLVNPVQLDPVQRISIAQAAGAPLYVAVPVALAVFEFLNYWQHRAMHELGGQAGGVLWRVHAPHHLPEGVYTLMHAAGHPLNTVVVRAGTMIVPWYLLGLSPEALLVANMINNLQGIVSHVNLDMRAGWANYLLVGTELHRYHHSADPREGKNYAAVLSVFDIAFGTFYYRPGLAPERLGVEKPEAYPSSFQFWKVMALPFVRARSAAEARRER